MDAGGHGARPPLRLVPEFHQFELNVRPAGRGARPNAEVTLLAGTHFEAGLLRACPARPAGNLPPPPVFCRVA